MATFQKFQDFSEQLCRGVHNFGSHTFKWALTNTAPVATNTILANITQITAANGYPAGGSAAPSVTVTEAAGTTTIGAGDTVFTASGGSIGPFRYAVLYNSTAGSANLVGYLDHGAAVTVTDGNTYTIDVTAAGIFTVA